jgi:hypothetical protein
MARRLIVRSGREATRSRPWRRALVGVRMWMKTGRGSPRDAGPRRDVEFQTLDL